MSELIDLLLSNSKQALFAGIEIHNKPIFPYRYQVCSILLINSWELLLKAYISAYNPEVRIIADDGTTKPFEECIAFVSSSLGGDFLLQSENITRLYDFRCQFIHFYHDDIGSEKAKRGGVLVTLQPIGKSRVVFRLRPACHTYIFVKQDQWQHRAFLIYIN